MHALDDSHVLFTGGAGKDAFRDKSKVTNFTSVPDTVKRWQQRLQLPDAPQRVLNLPGAYADLWQSKDGRIQLKLLVTTTGGHSWPGGKAVRGKTPSKAIDANTLIWRFFNSQLP
jgi:polyhydroxybutyrate depolymerase